MKSSLITHTMVSIRSLFFILILIHKLIVKLTYVFSNGVYTVHLCDFSYFIIKD